MANCFVRNIRDVEDVQSVPHYTNEQNDLLSETNGDVYVRTKLKYERITGIEQIEKDLDSLEKTVKSLSPKTDEQLEAVKDIRKDYDKLKANYDALTSENNDQAKRISDVEQNLKDLSSKVDNLDFKDETARSDAKDVANKLKDTDKTVKDLKNRVEKLANSDNQSDSGSSEDVEKLKEDIKKLQDEKDQTKTDIEELKNKLSDLDDKIANGDGDSEATSQDLEDLKDQLSDLKGTQEDSKQQIKALKEQLDALEPTDDDARKDIKDLQDKLKDFNPKDFVTKKDLEIKTYGGLDLDDKDELMELKAGQQYTTQAKNKPKNAKINNGWLNVKDRNNGEIRQIEFQPYTQDRVFKRYIYKDKLSDWLKDTEVYSVTSNIIDNELYFDMFGRDINDAEITVSVSGGDDITKDVKFTPYKNNPNAVSLFYDMNKLSSGAHLIDVKVDGTLYYQLGVNV